MTDHALTTADAGLRPRSTEPTTHHHHVLDDLDQLPENQLDVVAVPNSIDRSRHVSRRTQVIMVIAFPLVFILAFGFCYTSALHAPSPTNFPLALAGPASVTSQLEHRIDHQASGAFSITRTTDPSQARSWVKNRTVDAAIVVGDDRVTTIVASAGGRMASATAEKVGATIAAGLGVPATVQDVVPLTAGDFSGVGIFYLVLVCMVGAYLALGAVKQISRFATLGLQLAVSAISSVILPIVAFAVLSAFVGDFGADFGAICAALGIAMIACFTVGLLRIFLTRIFKQATIFVSVVLVMAVNLPSMGGSVPASMLPGFWQAIHNVWFGAGAVESIRSVVYFDGADFGRWFAQLVIWTGSLLLLNIVLDRVLHYRRVRTTALASSSAVGAPAMQSS